MEGEVLLFLGSSPAAIALAIIATTFVLEDAATVSAALLAAAGLITLPLALAALITGIFVGDLGLYALGSLARSRAWARAYVGDKRIERGRLWLSRRLSGALIGARFLPGFRLPVYTASGFLGVPLKSFAAITGAACLVWTGLIFGLVFAFGAMAPAALGSWKWAAGAVVLALVLAGPAVVRRLIPSADKAARGASRRDRHG
jgi:membrane protein DedA with SNARE-associated domain